MWKWTKPNDIQLIILDGDTLEEEFFRHQYINGNDLIRSVVVTRNNTLVHYENIVKYFDFYDLIQKLMSKFKVESYTIISISKDIFFLKSMMEYHVGTVLIGNFKSDFLKNIPDYTVQNISSIDEIISYQRKGYGAEVIAAYNSSKKTMSLLRCSEDIVLNDGKRKTVDLYFGGRYYALKHMYILNDALSLNTSGNNTKGIIHKKINKNWLLVLQLIKKLEESDYNIKVGRTIFQKICYVLSRYGTDMGMKFTKGTYGPYCSKIKDMITILSNNNLIYEREYGKMMLITVSKDFKINKSLYSKEDIENVNKTFQLFKRVKDTNQAELITTILYSYDILKETHDYVTENMIYSYIVEWKKRLNDQKSEMRIRELIKSLTGMKLIDTDYTKDYVENIFF